MNKALVSIIILNFNGRELLDDCLNSLRKQTYENIESIVADNCSTDDSVKYLKANFKEVEVVQLDSNYGFAGGNNRAASYAKGKYIMLLNNDTIADKELISELVEFIENHGYSAVSPKIMMHPSRSIINSVGVMMNIMGYAWDRGIGEVDNHQYNDNSEIFGATGGCMLLKKEVLEGMEFFDDRYWMYYEDIDFSWRLRLLGYDIGICSSALLYHKFRVSMDKHDKKKLVFHQEKNRICNKLKNFGLFNMIKYLSLNIYFDFKKGLINLLKGNKTSRKESLQRFKAYLWNLTNLPGTLIRRFWIQRMRVVNDTDILNYIDKRIGSHPVIVPDYRVMDKESFKSSGVNISSFIVGENETVCLGMGWSERIEITFENVKLTCRRCGDKGILFLKAGKNLQGIKLNGRSFIGKAISFEVILNGVSAGKSELSPEDFDEIKIPINSEILEDEDIIECEFKVLDDCQPMNSRKFELRNFSFELHSVDLF